MAYLLYLQNMRKSYSVINSHKSVILETLKLIYGELKYDMTMLRRFMKGLYVCNPPKPRYTSTWDVSKVLLQLVKWSPSENLSLKLLTYKLVSLIALSTAARAQTLFKLKVFDRSELCPVRTLKCYLRKTPAIRQSRQLFISY
ncbi:MAG: hypothetical protein ABW168_28295, partial [Sedimenticola sp.]